ncbi:MAG: hypothetical protein ACI9YT_000966 [Halobacteriales archaeon]|jgi:hypothetical protein
MDEDSIVSATRDALETDPEVFQERVEADAQVIKREINDGTFDNQQGIIGLEYEFYAVEDVDIASRDTVADPGALRRVPRRMLELIGFEKELGLHNAEMSTSPQPINSYGIRAQEAEVQARLCTALDRAEAEGMRLVSNALWTIPPQGETGREYLTDSVEADGVRIATNMSDSARYHAMANTDPPAGMRIDAPNVTLQADTVMPESLITSIQPHYQVPHAPDLPEYFRYGLRIAGPLLALGVNSPFFPPDLYDDVPPEDIVEDAWAEHRIRVFETSMNPEGIDKVRFPEDVSTVEEAVDRIAADETFVPVPVERGDRFDDEFAHFRTKHGTYWRWVRPVFGGATRSKANARIEFRFLPGQPTVRDTIAFQAAVAGLVEGMHARNHPVLDMDWREARENFYVAMRDGLDADLQWIDAEGDRTDDLEAMYTDLFDVATEGLRTRGLSQEEIARYLGPLRERVRRGATPARWKRWQVRQRLADGDDLAEAIHGMQRAYVGRQSETLIEGSFVDWLDN